MTTIQSVSDLFNPPPEQWGLRGDPWLWDEMSAVLTGIPVPATAAQLAQLLEQTFAQLVGEPLDPAKHSVFVQRYNHGGMSSGCISPAFWRKTGLPLLQARWVGPDGTFRAGAA
jgi:hypothetical protein